MLSRSNLRYCLVLLGIVSLQIGGGALPLTQRAFAEIRSKSVMEGHLKADCGSCHNLATGAMAEIGSGPGAMANCRRCHSADNLKLATSFHDDVDRNCTDCHSFHQPKSVRAGSQLFQALSNDDDQSLICLACHATGSALSSLSEGHNLAAQKVYHTDREGRSDPSESCIICHGRGSMVIENGQFMQAPAINHQSSHPLRVACSSSQYSRGYGIRNEIDSRIPLQSGLIACQSCHQLTSGSEDLLIRFESKYDICLGCHERRETALASAPQD